MTLKLVNFFGASSFSPKISRFSNKRDGNTRLLFSLCARARLQTNKMQPVKVTFDELRIIPRSSLLSKPRTIGLVSFGTYWPYAYSRRDRLGFGLPVIAHTRCNYI